MYYEDFDGLQNSQNEEEINLQIMNLKKFYNKEILIGININLELFWLFIRETSNLRFD